MIGDWLRVLSKKTKEEVGLLPDPQNVCDVPLALVEKCLFLSPGGDFYEFSFRLFRSKVEWTVVISRTFSNFLKMLKKKKREMASEGGWLLQEEHSCLC